MDSSNAPLASPFLLPLSACRVNRPGGIIRQRRCPPRGHEHEREAIKVGKRKGGVKAIRAWEDAAKVGGRGKKKKKKKERGAMRVGRSRCVARSHGVDVRVVLV